MLWWNENKKLKNDILRLEHQIKLMQEHIAAQNKEILNSNKKVSELEMLLDIAANTKRY